MKLYEIQLPERDNSDISTYHRCDQWEAHCLQIVGGFSKAGKVVGFWNDKKKGLFIDDMISYRIACQPEQFAALVDCAFRLFPDQLAIFTAEIGTAEIVTREDHAGSLARVE